MQYFSTPPINFKTGYYDKDEWFNSIIETCHDMEANDVLHVYNFGENKDLILDIYKDEGYDPNLSKINWDMVTIATVQYGKVVDDTDDTYVTDGSLWKELERIWNYEEFMTF